MERISFVEQLSKGRIAYQRFAELQERIKASCERDVGVVIYSEGQIGKTFLFLIACLQATASSFGKSLTVSMVKPTYHKMQESGILPSGYGDKVKELSRNKPSVSYASEIVSGMPVQLSSRLNEDIVSKIGEILNNASEHANAKHILIGRYKKPNRKYCFTCYDTGIGIPCKVREYILSIKGDIGTFTDCNALKWAIAPWNSTASHRSGPRGLGLSLLKEFVQLNHGRISICSGKALYSYSYDKKKGKCNEVCQVLSAPFSGTLFEMDCIADDNYYHYKGETYHEH